MKPLFFLLTLLAVTFAQPGFAKERDITPTVLKSFNATFTHATQVEWTISEKLYKARFELNGQVVCAYYSNDGQRLALTRNITSHQLPLNLQTALKKDYNTFWVSDLFEINTAEGTSYYVTLESAENKIVLHSDHSNWALYSKSKKD